MIRSMIKRKDGKVDTIIAQNVNEYRPHKIRFTWRRQQKSGCFYAVDFGVLDTETSHIGWRGWIYQWAVYFNGDYIYGRRPSELIELFRAWKQFYKLGHNKRILIYVHNLSYDAQYLKHYFKEYDPHARFFCTDTHSILIIDLDGIRICCSYKLTNLSLAKLSKDYATFYEKASGEIDYTQVRFQDQELTGREWLYMFSDVASQYDGVHGYLRAMEYEYASSAPYTSTGFVRESCRHRSEELYWREHFLEGALDLRMYNLCRLAYIGGQTIASWKYSGYTVDNVAHVDFTSSYPARQMMDYFPTGKPFWAGSPPSREAFDRLIDHFCCVFVARFTGIQIRPMITAPYIPGSKAIGLPLNDQRLNGKLISADEFAMAMTEIDWKWIKTQYTWDNCSLGDILCFSRGPAPQWMRDEVMKYYHAKCELKGKDPTLYAAAKARLNAIYGMSCTSICRPQYKMDEDLAIVPDPDVTPEKQLQDYYKSWKSFNAYQVGIYVTCHARDALHTLIEKIGYSRFCYCDTDSVFFVDSPQAREAVEEYNVEITRRALAAGAYVDDDNILGVAEYEEDCRKFRALHAKCYAYEDMSGELHVTIAGIPKKATRWINGEPVTMTNAQELRNIDNLAQGFVFHHCGGSQIAYVERPPEVTEIRGHMTELASAAIISEISKEISDSMYSVGKDLELLHLDFEQVLE